MKGNSLSKNYLYSVVYQVLIILVPLITTPYLARVLGAGLLGTYSYTNSVAYYFYLVSMLGISNYGNRTIAAIRDDQVRLSRVFSELSLMQISFGAAISFIYFVYLVFLYFTNYSIFIPSLIWFMYIISGLLDISWFFWGIEKFSVTVLRNIVIKLITTIGIFILVKNQNDLNIYIALVSGGFLASSIVLWSQVPKYVSITRVSFQEAYRHFKSNLLLFVPVIAVSIYTVMDKVMLGNISEMKELGFYDNIQKVMILSTGLITALGTVMLPRVSNLLANGNTDKALLFVNYSMQFSNFIAIGLSLGLAAIAPCFTTVFFGEEFSDTSTMMELFCITIIFVSWANIIRTQFLIPREKDKEYIISVFVGAVINVVINLALIPHYKAIGAVIGTIFAEFSVAFIQTVFVKKELPISDYFRNSMVFFIPGLLMFVTVRYFGSYMGISIISLITQILVGSLIYVFIGGFCLIKTHSALAALILKKLKTKLHT